MPMSAGLGTSGALYRYAVVFAVGCAFPDLQYGIIGVPVDFPAEYIMLGLVAFDTIGLFSGWRVMGHAAHLTGAAVGYYAVEGEGVKDIQDYQQWVVQNYQQAKQDWRKE